MKLISIFSVILLLLSGPLIAQQNRGTSIEPTLVENQELPLIPSEQIWFYGFIPKDAWVSHHYFLYNPHEDTITITKLIPGCDCTHIPQPPIVIPPQQVYTLPTRFDTRTYTGELSRDIHIVTDYEPAPEMDLYFVSLTASSPKSLQISPPSTLFIKGKESQTFNIKSLSDKTTNVVVLIDNDSIVTVSEFNFKINGQREHKLEIRPRWDRITKGEHYSCVVLDITRKEEIFRVVIPIKIVLF